MRKAGVNVNELACTCIMSLPLLDGSISAVGFFFFFFWLNDSLVLYRCSLSCAITLCPSHLPLHSSFSPLFLPRPLFVQFNHRAMRPWAPLLLFHHAVTLSGEKCSFIGFSHFFCLSHPFTPSRPIVLSFFPLSLNLSPSPSSFILSLPAKSRHHLVVVSLFAPVPSPTSLVICP